MAADTQVLVVGAGPAGLFMAAELNRHGVSCRIIDKSDEPTHDTRAASLQARTLEILESVVGTFRRGRRTARFAWAQAGK
jgi:2-polyprenyl-6-methoxyphenol hydroxylase-like FAD-dependent oxidoreductase